jgi:translocation protein SEC62
LIAAIAVIAVVRLILFVITMFAVPPGIWLFPNLFEDVGFFESFVPLWGWQKVPKGKKKKAVVGTAGKGEVVETAPVVTGEKSLHTTVEDASDEE